MIFLIENLYLFIGVFTILLYLWKSKVNQRKIVIDHVVLLFFGFIFYFYFPMFSFLNDSFTNDTQVISFNNFSKSNRQNLSLIFLGLVLVTIFADMKSKKLNLHPSRLGSPNIPTLRFILVTLTIILLPVIVQMLPFMFAKYDSADWIRGVRGPFLSYIVVLITLSCMYLSTKKTLKMLDLLKTDEVSKIYPINKGYAIAIKTDERFINNDMQDCKEKLMNLKAESFYLDFLKNLREKAYIQIYSDKL